MDNKHKMVIDNYTVGLDIDTQYTWMGVAVPEDMLRYITREMYRLGIKSITLEDYDEQI